MIEQNELEPVSTTVGQQLQKARQQKQLSVSKLHNNFVPKSLFSMHWKTTMRCRILLRRL